MKHLVLTFFVFLGLTAVAQNQTVGVFQYDIGTYNGYTLFTSNEETYLIDNCGRLINTWTSIYKPGLSVYLLENGDLLRTGRLHNTVFSGGGSGGRVERIDWNNNLIWSYDFSTNFYHQHHDIEPMPNGNILILCWQYKTYNEAISAGRDPNTMIDSALFPTYIIEVQPQGVDSINVVWEWSLWDHLIQDFDSTKSNYGNVANHPELMDINFYTGVGKSDWLHCNSIDYNPQLDQIIISSRALSEFFIIDHSTSTLESASHSGGNYGKGGDLLYRWGNPLSYRAGTIADKQLFGQHDVQWITSSNSDNGKILLFNNGQGRNFSSIDVLSPSQITPGEYILGTNNIYGPDTAEWTYTAFHPPDFYASFISGAQRLPNGNTLICHGPHGTFFEIDSLKNIVWEYVSPIINTGPVSQGAMIPISQNNNSWANSTFRATKYSLNYPAFNNLNLIPGQLLELNPFLLQQSCNIINTIDENPYIAEFNSELIKIVDVLGRPTHTSLNKMHIYIYGDGRAEKRIIIE